MESNQQFLKYPSWVMWLSSGGYVVTGVALLIGKLFFGWTVDSVTVILFLIVWIPFIIPLLRRLKYKDIEIEFIEQTVKQVEAEVAKLGDQREIEQDEKKHGPQDIKIDPYTIRIRQTSERVDERWFDVKVWLDAPPEFVAQVEKVVYERHPTFKNRFKETSKPPFEDEFRCWGAFTIRAVITLKDGEVFRRQKYIPLDEQ